MNRVLIACDEEALRILYSEELMEEGYEVAAACACDQVIGLVKEIRPDIILMDIGSNQTHSLDLLGNVTKICGDLPVLFCTARFPLQHIDKPVSADRFVLKSSRLTDLKLKVRWLLEGRDQCLPVSAREEKHEPVCRTPRELRLERSL